MLLDIVSLRALKVDVKSIALEIDDMCRGLFSVVGLDLFKTTTRLTKPNTIPTYSAVHQREVNVVIVRHSVDGMLLCL